MIHFDAEKEAENRGHELVPSGGDLGQLKIQSMKERFKKTTLTDRTRIPLQAKETMDQETSKQYTTFRSHLVESRHQSHVQFDKAILILAGGGLTVSLTILKNLIKLDTANIKPLLYWSWFLFLIPLVLTLLSFILSIKAIDKQIQRTDRYYLQDDDIALKERNIFAAITRYFNYASAASFVSAVICMMLFVYLNIK